MSALRDRPARFSKPGRSAFHKRSGPLQAGVVYHIFNRGNNREDLFREERNYRFFLERYAHHVGPVADTFAYCLLRNHFHLLVRIRPEADLPDAPSPTQRFSNLFNGYTKAINRAYGRTGSLFQKSFGRIAVTDERYFAQLVRYIHFNPQHHGFVSDSRDYPHSSYAALLGTKPTRLGRREALSWFGGREGFEAVHDTSDLPGFQSLAGLVPQDFPSIDP